MKGYQALNGIRFRIKERIDAAEKNDTPFWQRLSAGLWAAGSATAAALALGMPTGLGTFFDIVIYLLLHSLLFLGTGKTIAILFSLLRLPGPRRFYGSIVYTGAFVCLIFYFDRTTLLFASLVSGCFLVAGILLGLYINLLAAVDKKGKLVFLLLPLLLFLLLRAIFPGSRIHYPRNSDIAGSEDSPAGKGPYNYYHFTYGSGTDRHRKEFAGGAGLISRTVDASDYLAEWPLPRKLFWGFDEKNLPLNGRGWMPEGEGPFPLVLIVHGNHNMEYFSDAGYAYLGELLASRGFITVSIDENFLNYSTWSGTPGDDMILRTWILLQHILQIKDYHFEPGTPFSGKTDLRKIALIGHSRGGQAAAMAADYGRWFDADPSLAGIKETSIEAVAALAPTDSLVSGQKPYLRDIYYLVLHGAQDSDVNYFAGDRQFARASYSRNSGRFKASLYIGEANHSQFNSDWGRMDNSLPKGLFLNRSDTMPANLQREIAKVYLAAFLETALHGQKQYLPLFRDYRHGSGWLPPAFYVSRYFDGSFVPLLQFGPGRDKQGNTPGVAVRATGFTRWETVAVSDRMGKSKGVYAAALSWDKAGSYTILLSGDYSHREFSTPPEKLHISMAVTEADDGKGGKKDAVPQIDVEITAGTAVRLSLNDFMPVPPPFYTCYTLSPRIDKIFRKEKYRQATEPVFQTYELPIEEFAKNNPAFNLQAVTEITLYFNGVPGKVLIDSIGFIDA
jgi:pimeloyl-ACP methyl ester carboxylesterase